MCKKCLKKLSAENTVLCILINPFPFSLHIVEVKYIINADIKSNVCKKLLNTVNLMLKCNLKVQLPKHYGTCLMQAN